jgi:uncharacterized protein
MTGSKISISAFADDQMLSALSRHECVGCGGCCRWPGQVVLYRPDIDRISNSLNLTKERFLREWCAVVWWKWEDCQQFRIALRRRTTGNECVFVDGNRCTIHSVKPLLCKAGPAAWVWIREPEYFWFFVDNSPSFNHLEGTFAVSEANHWFEKTRLAEGLASTAHSIDDLAELSGVLKQVLEQLPLIHFTEEVK